MFSKASSPTNHSDSPVSLGSPQDRAGEEASSPHSPTIADSPLLDSPVGGKRGGKKGGEKKVGGTFRAGKDTKEVSRLRPGDSANELCVMEGRRSLATLVGMTDESVIMDIKAKQLAEVLLARPEFKDAISSGEMVMMSDIEKVRRVWKHPAMSDEAAEKSNLFRIESRYCSPEHGSVEVVSWRRISPYLPPALPLPLPLRLFLAWTGHETSLLGARHSQARHSQASSSASADIVVCAYSDFSHLQRAKGKGAAASACNRSAGGV